MPFEFQSSSSSPPSYHIGHQLAKISILMHFAGAALQSAGNRAGCEAQSPTRFSGACGHPDAAYHPLHFAALFLCCSGHPASAAGCPDLGCSSFTHGTHLAGPLQHNHSACFLLFQPSLSQCQSSLRTDRLMRCGPMCRSWTVLRQQSGL